MEKRLFLSVHGVLRGEERRSAASWLLVLLLVIGQPMGLAASDYFGQVTFNGVGVPGVTVTAAQGDRKASATTTRTGSITSPISWTVSGT